MRCAKPTAPVMCQAGRLPQKEGPTVFESLPSKRLGASSSQSHRAQLASPGSSASRNKFRLWQVTIRGQASSSSRARHHHVCRSEKCTHHPQPPLPLQPQSLTFTPAGRSNPLPGRADPVAEGPPPPRLPAAGCPRQAARQGSARAARDDGRRGRAAQGRSEAGQCASLAAGEPVQEQGGLLHWQRCCGGGV